MVIAVFVGVMGAAFADTYEPVVPPCPQPGCLEAQLLVTPDENLVAGQTVMVTGRRFGAETTGGTLQQCTADLTLCEAPRGSFTTGSNGEFNPVGQPGTPEDPQTIPVPFVVQPTFTATGGQQVDCRVMQCVIFATTNPPFERRAAAHQISFAAAPTTTSTSTTMVPTSTSTSTSTTMVPTSTSTSTSTTMVPTSTSTSTSTTMVPTSTSTSTSTSSTLPPTTTSTSTTTSTTLPPTTTSTSTTSTTLPPTTTSTSTSTTTSTTLPPTTTTTVPGGTTTTTFPGGPSVCAQILAAQANVNTQINTAIAFIQQSGLSPEQKATYIAQLEAARASANAQLNQLLASQGCIPTA